GAEGNGVIQFTGTFSTLTWTVTSGENWTGFQVGVPTVVSAAPEPTTLALLALGGVGGAVLARRRKMSA
uniref:PEP-CTERM sorting domain-containing protein n=1 Tax=Armatimonas sp. TaxID=1872638 RepID=UPI00286A0F9F